MKVAGREPHQFIFATIARRIGAPLNTRNIVAESQPHSILKSRDRNYSIDLKLVKPGTVNMPKGPSVTVAPPPEVLTTIESTSVNIPWANMRTLTYLSPSPQNPGYSSEQLKTAVGNCTKTLFNVFMIDFRASSRGHNGFFNGRNMNVSNPDNQGVSIVNEVNAYTANQ